MALALTGFTKIKEIDPPELELGVWDSPVDAETEVYFESNGVTQSTPMTVVIESDGTGPALAAVTTNAHGTFLVTEIKESDITGNQSDKPTKTYTLVLTKE